MFHEPVSVIFCYGKDCKNKAHGAYPAILWLTSQYMLCPWLPCMALFEVYAISAANITKGQRPWWHLKAPITSYQCPYGNCISIWLHLRDTGHFSNQGHKRSTVSVPSESLYHFLSMFLYNCILNVTLFWEIRPF